MSIGIRLYDSLLQCGFDRSLNTILPSNPRLRRPRL